jgi:hypothetical protein
MPEGRGPQLRILVVFGLLLFLCASKNGPEPGLKSQAGSNSRKKAVTLLAIPHQKVKRPRQDFQHKVALALVQQHDMI